MDGGIKIDTKKLLGAKLDGHKQALNEDTGRPPPASAFPNFLDLWTLMIDRFLYWKSVFDSFLSYLEECQFILKERKEEK